MRPNKRKMVLIASVFIAVSGNLLSVSPFNAEEKVAIVCFLEGEAWTSESDKKERSRIALFDWIKAGAMIETSSECKLILAFSNGDRYEFKGETKAILGKDGINSKEGSMEKLTSVPVMPQFVSISQKARPGSRLGGIRLRTTKKSISGLYPHEGTKVLAEEAILAFKPIEGVERYRVEIEDEWGNNIFSIETTSPRIVASPGVLKPGANYYWLVRTLDKDMPSIFGEAVFETVTEENARVRNAFKSQAENSKDVANLLLLARMELALGLRKEACKTLNTALDLYPTNTEIKKAISQINCKE